MNVDQLFDAARAVINEHNAAIGESNPGFVEKPDQVIAALKATGATSTDRLKSLSFEDILATLPTAKIGESTIKPIALAKDMARLFRGTEVSEKKLAHPAAVARMNLRQLIDNLDVNDNTSAVYKRLKELLGDRRFIVFKQGRAVDCDATFERADELRQGYDEIDKIVINDELKRVYCLGELPDNLVDENPAYLGRPLRRGEICDQTNRSWAGIPLEVRQLVRIGVQQGTIGGSIDAIHNLLDMILNNGANALSRLRIRYSEAALKFDELKEQGKLPTLRISLNPRSKGPFDTGRQVSRISK